MSYFYAFLLFGILILFHELGHFGAALAIGVQVETFSIGFGPKLFGFRCGEIDFRLSAIPVGGYVRTARDQCGGEGPPYRRSLLSRARWQRAVFIGAGPVMSMLLAVGIMTGIYMYPNSEQIDRTALIIASVEANSPAAQAGLKPGDRILEVQREGANCDFILLEEELKSKYRMKGIVEHQCQPAPFTITPHIGPKRGVGAAGWAGQQTIELEQRHQRSTAVRAGFRNGDIAVAAKRQEVPSFVMIQTAVSRSGGNPLNFQIMRNGGLKTVTVTPSRTNRPKTPWRIGISFNVPLQLAKLGLGSALSESIKLNQQNALMILQTVGGIIDGRLSPKLLSGPIGMAQMSREAAQAGSRSYLLFMAFVSLQLAIFNLLPIPMLDGGALLMLIIEMLAQHDISLQMKKVLLSIGLLFLVSILIFVIYNDLTKLLTGS